MKLEIINCGYWNERIKKIIIICLSCVIIIMNASINVFANYIEKQVYSFNYDDIKIYVEYWMEGNDVLEKITTYKDSIQLNEIKKRIEKNGSVKIYKNGLLIRVTSGDYLEYKSIVEGKEELIFFDRMIETRGLTRSTIYQACGRTEYHEHVSEDTEIINVNIQTSIENAVFSLLSLINVPYVKISGIAGKLVNTANKVDAEYIEVTDNKYFIHNYSANTSMNCHHMYFVFYDTIGGNRSVVATEWNFYQQVL